MDSPVFTQAAPDAGLPAVAAPLPTGAGPTDPVTPDGAQPTAEQAAAFFLETEDGSKYRSPEAALAALPEKAKYIQLQRQENESLRRQLEQMQQGGQIPVQREAAQAGPTEQDQFIAHKTAFWSGKGYSEADAKLMAEDAWDSAQLVSRGTQKLVGQQFSQMRDADYAAVKAHDPRFDVNRNDVYGMLATAARDRNPRMTPAQAYHMVFLPTLQQAGLAAVGAPAVAQNGNGNGFRPGLFPPEIAGQGAPPAAVGHSEGVKQAQDAYRRLNPNASAQDLESVAQHAATMGF